MSQEDVEVMEAAIAAVRRGDLDGFLSLAHPEIEFRSTQKSSWTALDCQNRWAGGTRCGGMKA